MHLKLQWSCAGHGSTVVKYLDQQELELKNYATGLWTIQKDNSFSDSRRRSRGVDSRPPRPPQHPHPRTVLRGGGHGTPLPPRHLRQGGDRGQVGEGL